MSNLGSSIGNSIECSKGSSIWNNIGCSIGSSLGSNIMSSIDFTAEFRGQPLVVYIKQALTACHNATRLKRGSEKVTCSESD